MKKLLVRSLIVVVVLVAIAVIAVVFLLDGAIKRGVETVGPQIAKVDVKLDSVSVSLLSGSGKVKALVIGNPEGFKSPHAISVGTASLALSPGSLLSDKIVVRSIRVEQPEIIYELDNTGHANLMRIKSNLSSDSLPATNTPSATEKANKKLQVDDFVITGGKVTVAATMLGGKGVTAPLPDIHFTNLGSGPEGITAAELTKRILTEVTEKSLEVAQKAIASAGTEVLKAGKESLDSTGKTATESVKKVTGGLKGLFDKKKDE